MKKKFLSIMLAAAMVAAFAGCGNKKADENVKTEVTAEEYGTMLQSDADIYKNYVTLPEYKNIEVTVDRTILEVTDEDIESYISGILSSFGTTEQVTEGVTAVGDKIVLDYSGKMDGVAFSGGTATDATYTVGSKKFIEDLDNGLAGLTVGQEYEIPCRFPDSYSDSTMAGKEVVFVVTVTAIQKTTLPELTDEWVAANAENIGAEVTTVEELRQKTKEYLTASAESQFAAKKYQQVWAVISENAVVNDYPQEELNNLINTFKTNLETEYEQTGTYYGYSDKWTFFSQYYGFSDEDGFNEYATESAKEYLKEKMILTMIAVENNLTVTADDIYEMGEELAQYYNYENYQEILNEYGNEMNKEVGYEVLYQKTSEYLNSNAIEQ